MRTATRCCWSFIVGTLASVLAACSGSNGDPSQTAAGGTAHGGGSGAGGSPGNPQVGGSSATGGRPIGVAGSGGALASGGTSPAVAGSSGAPATGGNTATAGSSSLGGLLNTAGSSAAVGSSGNGGSISTGGHSASGGVVVTGGVAATGGVSIAGGGSSATGGMACVTSGPTDFSITPESCASATACSPVALGRSWGPPVRIDDGTSCKIDTVRAAAQDNGIALVASNDSSPLRVRARRVAATGNWSPIETVGSAWGTGLGLAWGAQGSALLVGLGNNRVLAATSLDGSAFGLPVDVSSATTTATKLEMAMDATGNGLLAWTQPTTSINHSLWENGSWSSPASASGSFMSTAIAPIPGSGGGFVMVRLTTTGDVTFAFYTPSDGWSPTEKVSSFGNTLPPEPTMVNVAVDTSGRTHVVWTTSAVASLPHYLMYRWRLANGFWSSNYMMASEVDAAVRPLIAVSDVNHAFLVWGSTSILTSRHRFRYTEIDGNWLDITNFDGLDVQTYPALAMDPQGNAILAWGRNTSAGGVVRCLRHVAGAGWDSYPYLTLYANTDATAATSVSVAMSATGEAIVSYVVKTASGDRLYANLLR